MQSLNLLIQYFLLGIVKYIDNNNERKSDITLRFKGEMIWVEESNAILFIGSPNITNLDEMYRKVSQSNGDRY